VGGKAEAVTYSWLTMAIDDRKVQEVDIYSTLEEALEAMSMTAWEDDSGKLGDWVTDDEKVVAVAIFERPSLDLLVTCSDGRILRFEMPARYRE
jgi:hypothetical protein